MSCNRTPAAGRLAALAVVLAGAAGLAGCQYDGHVDPPTALLPTEHYGVQVTSRPEEIAIAPHATGLSANQQAALGQFVSRWRDNGGGVVLVRAPVDGPDPAASRRVQDEMVAFLVKLGVPRERVSPAGYVSNRAPAAPILASYDRFEAVAPACGGAWDDLTTTGSNTSYRHFGCAVTANIAAQVANPRDFLAPAVETPADNSRRAVVLGKYRAGQVTSSAKDEQANGKVSDSAGGSN
jgi:pilus assembly protein CpaD